MIAVAPSGKAPALTLLPACSSPLPTRLSGGLPPCPRGGGVPSLLNPSKILATPLFSSAPSLPPPASASASASSRAIARASSPAPPPAPPWSWARLLSESEWARERASARVESWEWRVRGWVMGMEREGRWWLGGRWAQLEVVEVEVEVAELEAVGWREWRGEWSGERRSSRHRMRGGESGA